MNCQENVGHGMMECEGPKTMQVNTVEGKKDPWMHRSDTMVCATCMWFVEKLRFGGLGRIGRCRRHAPSMNGYPVVYLNDWCGDHKVDENK